ncbi:MAG TPA: hypothetical protein VGH73_07530 [Thermoanaerobaculia bacterium]
MGPAGISLQALTFFLVPPSLFAADRAVGAAVPAAGSQPVDLAMFLNTLQTESQGLPGNQSLPLGIRGSSAVIYESIETVESEA